VFLFSIGISAHSTTIAVVGGYSNGNIGNGFFRCDIDTSISYSRWYIGAIFAPHLLKWAVICMAVHRMVFFIITCISVFLVLHGMSAQYTAIALTGGHSNNGTKDGLFYYHLYNEVSFSASHIGADVPYGM
jgi:hypothetical protein